MGSPAGGVCRPWTPQASTRPGPLGPNALRHAEQLIAAVAPLKLDPAAAWTLDPTVLPHFAHALRARAPDRDGTTFTTGLGTVLDGIARRFATPSRHLDGTTTSATFIKFCKQLLHDIDGTIFLIVDDHSAHKSAAELHDGAKKEFARLPATPEII